LNRLRALGYCRADTLETPGDGLNAESAEIAEFFFQEFSGGLRALGV
jgi:hypothetical protein